MILTYLLIWGLTVLASASAIWALAWCIERGQIQQANARVIFNLDDTITPHHTPDQHQTLSTRGE